MFSANNSKGFTLMEVLIAMAVLSIGILGVAKMQLSSTSYNRHARTITESSTIGSAVIEKVLSLSYKDSLLMHGTDITKELRDPSSGEVYTVNWKVYNTSENSNSNRVTLNNVKQIDIRVSWDNKGKTSTFKSVYYKAYTLKR